MRDLWETHIRLLGILAAAEVIAYGDSAAQSHVRKTLFDPRGLTLGKWSALHCNLNFITKLWRSSNANTS